MRLDAGTVIATDCSTNYYVTGNNVDLNLEGFELKCEKCKRVLRLKNYTEQILVERSENGVFRV